VSARAITDAACRKPFGAITSRRTAIRLSTVSRVTVIISTPISPGRWPLPKPLKSSGVVVVMKDYCIRLAVGAQDCQARSLLGGKHHASFHSDGSTGDKKRK
jgi:hypothetical protein